MKEETEISFTNFDVERVKNGFILTINRRQCMVSDYIYVFNTLEQLSEFIKNLDNLK